jgi:methionine synthase II (cobalamin-independent)
MHIPTEPVGSLPRPAKLQAAIAAYDAGTITKDQLTQEQDAACLDSIKRMEATGSPIVSDGEQRVSSFATYPLADTLAGTGLAENLQNGFAKRLIGSTRRECVDHMIVLGEIHLRRVLKSYADYYNSLGTHRSLKNKDAPVTRPVQPTGVISSCAILGGLHHHYARA